ncbi:MAG: hypothetical protein KF774_19170 [Planctomyces sp.]|nr:hypothetical protein [Planctomyces sp.]
MRSGRLPVSGRRPASRSGATLTEVLMSLLIMGVGILSVITLFPISMLRSIQATQLTNARLMRQNAEQVLSASFQDAALPEVRFDIGNHSTIPGLPVTDPQFRGEWQPNTTYAIDQIVIPTRPAGSRTPQPNVWFVCTAAGDSGSIEPNWQAPNVPGAPIQDFMAAWTSWFDPTGSGGPPVVMLRTTSPPVDVTWYSARNYVIDPLGWAVYANQTADLLTGSSPNDFGFKVERTTGLANSVPPRPTTAALAVSPYLLRLNGGATTVPAAESLIASPDSWTVELTSTLADPLPNDAIPTATFVAGIDLSNVSGFNRIVLTSLQDSRVMTRPITGATINSVSWVEPLPVGFVADGPARIETYTRRYSWLATVNKDLQGHTHTTVAVFYNRAFSPADEHVYDANFGNTSATGQWSIIFPDQIRLNWDVAAEPDPLLRPGNFLLDARHATWYRIVDVSDRTDGSALLTVNRPVPTAHRTLDPTAPASVGRAILMRGIIELFEL